MVTFISSPFSFSVLRSEIGLHEAARKNQPELIKKLLAAKVDVNSRNNVSVSNQQLCFVHVDAAMRFLRVHFDQFLNNSPKMINFHRLTELHFTGHARPGMTASSSCCSTVMPTSKPRTRYMTKLWIRNERQLWDAIIKWDHYYEADILQYGMKAMLWAAWFGHVSAMKILVNNGADVRCVNKVGQFIRPGDWIINELNLFWWRHHC